MKKISIVIPSYNQGKYLKNTIESIVRQDYENYEIIIVDGCSTDNTLDILKFYSNKIGDKLMYIYEKDNGFADGVNKGLARANGDILGIQSSDDMYTPNTFKEVDKIYSNSNPLVVFGQRLIVDSQLTLLKESTFTGDANLENLFMKNIFPFQDATFFSREAFHKAGYLTLPGDYVADWSYWLKILSFGNGLIVDKFFSYYTVHADQRTQTKALKFGEDFDLAVNKWLRSEYYKNIQNDFPKEIALSGILLNRAYWHKEAGNFIDSMGIINKAFSQYPFCKDWPAFSALLYNVGGMKALIKYYGINYVCKKIINRGKKILFKKPINKYYPDPKQFLD